MLSEARYSPSVNRPIVAAKATKANVRFRDKADISLACAKQPKAKICWKR